MPITPEALGAFLGDINAVCKQHKLHITAVHDDDYQYAIAVEDEASDRAPIEWRERDRLYEPEGACDKFEGDGTICKRCEWYVGQHKP